MTKKKKTIIIQIRTYRRNSVKLWLKGVDMKVGDMVFIEPEIAKKQGMKHQNTPREILEVHKTVGGIWFKVDELTHPYKCWYRHYEIFKKEKSNEYFD